MKSSWFKATVIAALIASLPQVNATAIDPPAYIKRGDEVEKHYKTYASRLEKDYELLRAALKKDAPELVKKLKATPPKPVDYGYQILPRLIPDDPLPLGRPPTRASSTSYSWLRTDRFIDWEIPKLEELEEKLKVIEKLPETERRPVYEKLVDDYPALESNQKTIDHHIQYNRFWQKTIAEDKPRFERLTLLHNAVLERQSILDALKAESDADFRKKLAPITGINANLPRPELETILIEREKSLAQHIHEQNEHIQPPKFLKIKHPKPNVWIVQVPLYTDIPSPRFVSELKKTIEKVWRVEDKENVYRIELQVYHLSAEQLYKPKRPPHKGEHIDVAKHVERFPKAGGVITTGTNSTFAIPSRYVALGPQDLSHNVLAHEFGHILGFVDGYFRGYHDLGSQGFEVLEIVPDPEDIMCTPGLGRVQRHHFEKLISKTESTEPSTSSLTTKASAGSH